MSKCKRCGSPIIEDNTNPNIHYSIPEDICLHCKLFDRKNKGEYYQAEDGSYHIKK